MMADHVWFDDLLRDDLGYAPNSRLKIDSAVVAHRCAVLGLSVAFIPAHDQAITEANFKCGFGVNECRRLSTNVHECPTQLLIV